MKTFFKRDISYFKLDDEASTREDFEAEKNIAIGILNS